MIKVLELRLENFARIATGLQVNTLKIDFSKLTNELFLLIGKNGSGKTSILHTIHPFAYNTSIGDNIPNSEFIVAGMDGEKYIKYLVDDDIYEITHKYLRKDDNISVKSFISRNGEELNASGTVNTFKDIIFDVFELDETYLGLLSLGNTVKGFVEYTGGDRKQLMSKIFTKLNIYGRYYKNASQEVRNLKSVLNNVTAKLDKYNSFDREEAKRTLLQIEQKMESLSDSIKELSIRIGGLTQKISSNEEFIEDYQSKRKMLMDLLDKIEILKGKVQTTKDIPVLQQNLDDVLSKIANQKINKVAFETNLKTSLDYTENLKSDLEDTKNLIEKISQDIDLNELDETKANIEAKIASLDIPSNLDLPIEKDRLVKANIFLEELKGLCIDFVTEVRNQDIIAETAEKFLVDDSLLPKSEKRYENLVQVLQQSSYIRNANIILDNVDKFELPNIICEHKDTCLYVNFYNTYKEAVSKKTGELDNELNKKKADVDIAKDIVTIGRIVNRLKTYLKRNSDILKLPTEIFNPNTFVTLYMEKREVFNVDLMSSLVDLAERKELKEDLENQLLEIEQKRKNNESIRENHDAMVKRVKSLEEKLKSSQKSVDYYKDEIPLIDAEISKLEDLKDKIEKTITSAKELESCRSQVNELKVQIASMESKTQEIEQLQSEIFMLKKNSTELELQKDKFQEEKENINLTLSTIRNLESEQFTLMGQYDEAETIRKAVSPSKGVPLEFIKKYIKGDLIRMVNELLDLVYHGDLSIDPKDVEINEDQFTIPYRRRGTLISDISHASDGERAVMSLAFSLSLARITSKKYNILLLDEMDTSLDTYSRGKYIDMIVAYMNLIKCHQVFLISHNSMFDNYPVNVLLTSDMNISNIKQANIIKLWRKTS